MISSQNYIKDLLKINIYLGMNRKFSRWYYYFFQNKFTDNEIFKHLESNHLSIGSDVM